MFAKKGKGCADMPFNRLKKLSEVFMKKLDQIEVDANRCSRVRAAVGQCTHCKEICPVDAISITQDEIQLKDCVACGLCTVVCPTNALKWNHPPLVQLYQQWVKYGEDNRLTLTCQPMLQKYRATDVKVVPCLGMVPSELWIGLGRNLQEIHLVCDPKLCESCQVKTGYRCLQEQLDKANIVQDVIHIHEAVQLAPEQDEVDHERRRMLRSFFEEAKETNTIAVKEMLEVGQTLSPFEKFERYVETKNQLKEMTEEVKEMKVSIVDKLLQDALLYTDKREILLNQLQQDEALEEQMEFQLPKVKEGCTLCGACAFLCPTEALYHDENSLILAPSKCVSCNLCVEICWEKHMELIPRKGKIFREKYMFLYKK